MDMPKYSQLVRFIAQLGAVVGCILGAVVIAGGLASFKFGVMLGISAVSGGLYMIFGSLAALGVVYCFLALVQAQIETRNAVVDYLDAAARIRK